MGKWSKKAERLASKCKKMRKTLSARELQREGEIEREGREEIEGEGGRFLAAEGQGEPMPVVSGNEPMEASSSAHIFEPSTPPLLGRDSSSLESSPTCRVTSGVCGHLAQSTFVPSSVSRTQENETVRDAGIPR